MRKQFGLILVSLVALTTAAGCGKNYSGNYNGTVSGTISAAGGSSIPLPAMSGQMMLSQPSADIVNGSLSGPITGSLTGRPTGDMLSGVTLSISAMNSTGTMGTSITGAAGIPCPLPLMASGQLNFNGSSVSGTLSIVSSSGVNPVYPTNGTQYPTTGYPTTGLGCTGQVSIQFNRIN